MATISGCMAIRALIFDLGGVLVAEGEPVGRRRWESRLGLAVGALDRIVADAVGPGWVGGRAEVEIALRIGRATGLGASEVEELLEDFHSHAYLEPVVATFVANIRSRCKVAVLSNAGPDLRGAMVRKFDLENLVDLMVISAEEGVQKPDAAIYLSTADRLGVSPAECLFVDDQERNVEGARAVGMLAVLYDSPETTVAVIRQYLTTVDQVTEGSSRS